MEPVGDTNGGPRDELLEVLTVAYEQARKEGIDFSKIEQPNAGVRLFELSTDLESVIINDARFPGSAPRMIRGPDGGAGGFYPHFIGLPLLRHALRTESPDEAVRWLEKVMNTKVATGKTVEALWGSKVTEEIKLTSEVSIIPIEQIPESPQKRWVSGINAVWSSLPSVLSFTPPASALVVERRVEPFLSTGEPTPSSYDEAQKVSELLNDVTLALTMIGPRVVISAGRWFTFNDPELQEASLLSGARTWQSLEIMPSRSVHDFPALDPGEAQELVPAYLALRGETKRKVRIALQRLSQAQRRHSLGDQAVELATALETLLGDGGNTEMTHKINVRSARLVGGTNDNRKKTAAIIKKTYAIRSTLTHTGHVDAAKQEIIDGEKMSRSDVIGRAVGLSVNVVKIIIRRGSIPEWEIFDITEQT